MKNKSNILYLGLNPSRFHHSGNLVHLPLIEIQPRPFEELAPAFLEYANWSHVLLTSQNSVKIFFETAKRLAITTLAQFLAVGQATAEKIRTYGNFSVTTAQNECGEGIIEILPGNITHLFYPHSEKSRPFLADVFFERGIPYTETILYDTFPKRPSSLPSLDKFDEIVFTSPSVVEAFVSFFGSAPRGKKLTAIGPVTQKMMDKFFSVT